MKIIFIKEKSCKMPTIWGWLVVIAGVSLCIGLLTVNCNSFLSVNHPINAKVMVVEGWLPTYVLSKAAEEFKAKRYSLVFSTGMPIEKGDLFWQEKTYADMACASMLHLGLDSSAVVSVPAL